MSPLAAFFTGMAVGIVLLFAIGSALTAWIVDTVDKASRRGLDEESQQ